MKLLRQLIALGMILGLLHLTVVDTALAGEATARLNPDTVRQQVNLFGLGAKVKVRLADGKSLKGTIEGIEDGSFLVASKATSPISVTYDEVVRLKFAKQTYKVKGDADALQAKRVVVGLGVGKHIVVKTAEGKEYHGKIQSLSAEDFTVLPDNQATPVQISYGDIRATGPNMSRGTKILLIVVAAVVITAIIVGERVGD